MDVLGDWILVLDFIFFLLLFVDGIGLDFLYLNHDGKGFVLAIVIDVTVVLVFKNVC